MISAALMNYVLLTHPYPHYPASVIYFKTKELCESAKREIVSARGGSIKPMCFQVKEESKE